MILIVHVNVVEEYQLYPVLQAGVDRVPHQGRPVLLPDCCLVFQADYKVYNLGALYGPVYCPGCVRSRGISSSDSFTLIGLRLTNRVLSVYTGSFCARILPIVPFALRIVCIVFLFK